eukprot:COSAG04_NODE_6481_length_1317_cov_1.818555_1_plen_297_part_00
MPWGPRGLLLLACAASGATTQPLVRVAVEPSTVKIALDAAAPSAASAEGVDIAAQMGECESTQLWVRPLYTPTDMIDIRNLTVDITPLPAAGGGASSYPPSAWTVRQQGYVHCRNSSDPDMLPSRLVSPSWQPDPLLTLDRPDAGSSDIKDHHPWAQQPTGIIPFVKSGSTQSVWLTTCVPRDGSVAPGNYSGKIQLRGLLTYDGDDTAAAQAWSHSFSVKLEVWPITLPELGAEGTLGTAFLWGDPTRPGNSEGMSPEATQAAYGSNATVAARPPTHPPTTTFTPTHHEPPPRMT